MSKGLRTVKGDPRKVARQLDAEIDELIGSGVELGYRLIQMRESGSYKLLPEFGDEATFAQYLESKKTLSRSYANRMMQAAVVEDAILADDVHKNTSSQNGTSSHLPLSHLFELARCAKFEYDRSPGSDGRLQRVVANVKNPRLLRDAYAASEKYYAKYSEKKQSKGEKPSGKTTTIFRNALAKSGIYSRAGVNPPRTTPLKPFQHIGTSALKLREKLDKYSRDGGDPAGFIKQDKWTKAQRESVRRQLDECRKSINAWLRELAG